MRESSFKPARVKCPSLYNTKRGGSPFMCTTQCARASRFYPDAGCCCCCCSHLPPHSRIYTYTYIYRVCVGCSCSSQQHRIARPGTPPLQKEQKRVEQSTRATCFLSPSRSRREYWFSARSSIALASLQILPLLWCRVAFMLVGCCHSAPKLCTSSRVEFSVFTNYQLK